MNTEMVRILTSVKDHYNIEYYLCYYTFYDLINAFCTEIITEPRKYKYLWCKNAENKQKQFLFNTKSKNSKKLDFERFLERLIRMKKALEKKR